MRTRTVLVGVAGLAMAGMLAGFTAQPDKDKPKAPAPAQPGKKDAGKPAQPSEQDAMELMKKAAEPGEGHKVLRTFDGKWNAKVWSLDCTSGSESTSEGTMVNTWVLGNRYLRQEFKGSFMEQPFEGIAYFGYDNLKKQYFSTWFDTMSTGIMLSTGKYDPATKTFTLNGTFTNPMTGQDEKAREVIKIIDDNKHVMEMWGASPTDGKDTKMMEITYTRPGKGPEPAKPAGKDADKGKGGGGG